MNIVSLVYACQRICAVLKAECDIIQTQEFVTPHRLTSCFYFVLCFFVARMSLDSSMYSP